MTLGEKIAILRKQRGLSQEDLAAQMSISRQAVSRWEQDESMPDIDNMVLLSSIFKVSTDYLLKGEEFTFNETSESDIEMPPAKEKKPVPWVYEKFFANYFIYIVVIGIYIVLGYVFDSWHFSWPILVIVWLVHWGIEAWYGIEDEE